MNKRKLRKFYRSDRGLAIIIGAVIGLVGFVYLAI